MTATGEPVADGRPPQRADIALLAPIESLASALDTSVRTLKRIYKAGGLPVVIVGTHYKVPADFADAVIRSIRPGKAANVADIGRQWFDRSADTAAAEVAA